MSEALFPKKVKCPLCNNSFSTMKVKRNACIVDKKDEDFCIHYKSYNPTFYEIFVCPFCGYSASESSFNQLTPAESKTLKDAFSGFNVARSFCGERNINDAIDSYKLALYTSKSKRARESIIAGICLRIAWLYRVAEDEKERTFLEYALNNYKNAYYSERFPIGNFDEITLQYLIGELLRRVGKFEEAVSWFSKAVANPLKNINPRIEKIAREQWGLAKEQLREIKNGETL